MSSHKKIFSHFAIALICFAFFNKAITNLIDTAIVNVFFNEFRPSGFKDFLLLSTIPFILGFYWSKRLKYIPSNNVTVTLVFISCCILYYRIINPVWNFYSLSSFPKLKYLDLIFFITSLNLILCLINWVRSGDPKPKLKPNTLFDDNPITRENKDLLGYKAYASLIADKINSSIFRSAFAIGINGHWGIGKTSFLELMKESLGNDNKIFVEFNPWASQSPDSIIKDFFTTLQEEVRPYYASLARKLVDYSEKLVNINDNALTKAVNSTASAVAGFDSLNQIQNDINKALEEINLKLIITIDDLDRLDSKEIIEVLRLIRNTANFYNTFFIVAYDRNYVVNAIKELNTYRPHSYLEKIFQIELTLPYFDRSIFRKKLLELILPAISKELHEEISESIVGTSLVKTSYFDEWLSSMRDVTRLANSLVLNYQRLENEVYFSDFIRMELLRLKYPGVYELIFRRTSDFLSTEKKSVMSNFGINADIKSTYHLIELPKANNDSKSKFKLQQELSDRRAEYGIDEPDVLKIVDFLESIFDGETSNNFFRNLNERNPLSIAFPSNFAKYFTYSVLSTDFSEVEFSNTRHAPLEEIYKKIDNWIEKGQEGLLRKRYEEIKDFDSKADFENVLRAIIHLATRNSKNALAYGNLVGYNGRDIELKLDNSNNKIVNQFYEGKADEFKVFVEDLFVSAKPPFLFETALFSEWFKDWPNNLPLTKEDGEKIICDYFERYSNSIEKLDVVFWNLFHSCRVKAYITASGQGSDTITEYVLPRAKEIAVNFIKNKDLDSFLRDIINPHHPNNKVFSIGETIFYIWDSWPNFKEFINALPVDSSPYLDEFKDFMKAFEDGGLRKYVPYEFKTIPARK